MPIDYNALAIPKGKTRKQLKARKDRDDAQKLKAFRDAVWLREQQKDWRFTDHTDYALCQSCGRVVNRAGNFIQTGEVHHRISRRHKATRYDPDNGVLLCNYLVNGCHEKAERGEIDV